MSAVEGLGYGVIEAADGPAGPRAIESAPAEGREAAPDLLLVDFAMPGMTGPEVVKVARRARPGLPAVLITGDAEAEALDRLAARGLTVLRKPSDLRDLEDALEALLGVPLAEVMAP